MATWVIAYIRDSWSGFENGAMHAARAASPAFSFQVVTASGPAACAASAWPSAPVSTTQAASARRLEAPARERGTAVCRVMSGLSSGWWWTSPDAVGARGGRGRGRPGLPGSGSRALPAQPPGSGCQSAAKSNASRRAGDGWARARQSSGERRSWTPGTLPDGGKRPVDAGLAPTPGAPISSVEPETWTSISSGRSRRATTADR